MQKETIGILHMNDHLLNELANFMKQYNVSFLQLRDLLYIMEPKILTEIERNIQLNELLEEAKHIPGVLVLVDSPCKRTTNPIPYKVYKSFPEVTIEPEIKQCTLLLNHPGQCVYNLNKSTDSSTTLKPLV